MDLRPKDDRPAERRQRTTLGGDPPVTAEGFEGVVGTPPGDPYAGLEGAPPITEAELAAKLEGIGLALNRLHHPEGASALWIFEADELDAIAGPGARELNKRGDTLRRLLAHLDLVAVAVGFVSYLGRQLDQLRAAREAAGEAEAEPEGEPEHVGPEAFGIGDLEVGR